MVQFKFVKEVPKDLAKDEYVIEPATFMEQILLHQSKTPKNGLTGSYHIRMVTDSVAQAYDPENMSAYSVKSHLYEGIAFKNNEDLSKFFINMYQNEYPAVFLKYVDTKIRTRPVHTKTVYYVDTTNVKGVYDLFYRYGFVELKDSKPTITEQIKKVVGKPAVTNKEAESLKTLETTEGNADSENLENVE